MNDDQRLSAVDRAWLLMERSSNPMTVVALSILEEPLEYERLCDIVAQRFLAFERFRCRPVAELLGARWAVAEDFDLADHVHRVMLPGEAGKRELEALAAELASTPLSSERPRWSFHLVEHYQGGSALIVRIHHCYADGIALVRVFLSLTESEPRTAHARKRAARRMQRSADAEPEPVAAVDWLAALSSLAAPAAGLLERTAREGAHLAGRGLHYALNPGEVATVIRDAADVATEMARIGTLADDPLTGLKHRASGVKHVAWGERVPFEEVRTISRVLACTINDVITASLAGALGRYLESQGEAVDGLVIRAAVPVNLRGDDSGPPTLGNQFGLVFVDLPIGIRHPLERLYAVHARMQALKGSHQPLATLGLLAAVGSLPAAVEDPALALFSAKASLVFSNVPGPRQQLYMGGAPVSQLLFWVPQAGNIGVGVSALTYHDQLQFGVLADRNLISTPDELVRLIHTELERLVLLVLIGSGGSLAH
jgi:WS/DGAT/MGAT family acyltransferase